MSNLKAAVRRVWLAACVVMLPVGLLDVWRPMATDVNIDVPWLIAMGLLTAPSGLAAGFLFCLAFWRLEQALLGESWHFSPYALVCLSWSVMFFSGYRQWFDPRAA
jgi:hypothetical protein